MDPCPESPGHLTSGRDKSSRYPLPGSRAGGQPRPPGSGDVSWPDQNTSPRTGGPHHCDYLRARGQSQAPGSRDRPRACSPSGCASARTRLTRRCAIMPAARSSPASPAAVLASLPAGFPCHPGGEHQQETRAPEPGRRLPAVIGAGFAAGPCFTAGFRHPAAVSAAPGTEMVTPVAFPPGAGRGTGRCLAGG